MENKKLWIVVAALCCLLSCGSGFMCGATLNELGRTQQRGY